MAVKVLFALYPSCRGTTGQWKKPFWPWGGLPHTELSGEEETVFQTLKAAFLAAAEEGATVMWALFTNTCEARDPFRKPERLSRFPPLEIARKALEGLAARSALDIGTGTGVFAEASASLGLFTLGIDPRSRWPGPR